jgi:hypothetical protein
MNFRRPAIITAKPTAPKAVRAAPRQLSGDVGRCLSCGEPFSGPDAVRLRHGCIRRRKWGTEFIELPFEDRSKLKWVCSRCAWECDIIGNDGRFSERLSALKPDGQCVLCHRCIEPYPLDDWSSAVLIEVGDLVPSTRGGFSIFRPRESGHVHYMCMDDLKLELWRMIDSTDAPDFREYLCE